VSAGAYHTIGLLDDGTLWAWGSNLSGQLGIDDTSGDDMLSPVQVGSDAHWVGVSSGREFSVAIKDDGTLWAWGDNAYGQLGKPTPADNLDPLIFVDYQYAPDKVNDDTDWVAISCGAGHVLALKSTGALYAWGWNMGGQLGLGDTDNRSEPTPVDITSNWCVIGTGGSHSLAINADGELYAWGLDDEGQLGLEMPAPNQPSPMLVDATMNWITVAAGLKHTIALNGSGELYAWGWNDDGQLGLGDTTQRTSPVQIGAASDWVALACGESHSLAFSDDGIPSLWAWGLNGDGQLGDGGVSPDTRAPIEITTWP
jgi:alpha-tubulin suppressor-like RCC1 family protein